MFFRDGMNYRSLCRIVVSFNAMRIGPLLVFACLAQIILTFYTSCAQASSADIQVTYQNQRISISAKDADIKNILLKIAEKAQIDVQFPSSINKTVTMKRKEISLKKALQSLLRGLNHVIIYSKKSKSKSRISQVLVYSGSTGSRISSASERRIARRIQSYERQIDSLRTRLAKMDRSSRRGQTYEKRIQQLEKKIEQLER